MNEKHSKKRGRKKKAEDEPIALENTTKAEVGAKSTSQRKSTDKPKIEHTSDDKWMWKSEKFDENNTNQLQVISSNDNNNEDSKANTVGVNETSPNHGQTVKAEIKSSSTNSLKNLSFKKIAATDESVENTEPTTITGATATTQQMSPDAEVASGISLMNQSNDIQNYHNSHLTTTHSDSLDQGINNQPKRKVFEVNMLLNSSNISPFAAINENPSKLVSLKVNYDKCADFDLQKDSSERTHEFNGIEEVPSVSASTTSTASSNFGSDTEYVHDTEIEYQPKKQDLSKKTTLKSKVSKPKKGTVVYGPPNRRGRKRKNPLPGVSVLSDIPNVTNIESNQELVAYNSSSQPQDSTTYPTFTEIPVFQTPQQTQQIVRTNNLVNISNGVKIEHEKVLPPLMELMRGKIPEIPQGYVPLVMAPDGKLIPMELLRVNPEDNSISIMRPIWDSNIEAENSNTEIIEPLSMEFTEDDRIASIQLHLMSKEPLTYVNEHMIALPKYKNYIDYYNRLSELEEIKIYNTYKMERNKYQELLNQLENEERLLNEEQDLMEMRDYLLLREDIGTRYVEEQIKHETASVINEIESMVILEYTTRLAKLKNFLIMENERIKKNTSKLCRINNNKSHSIWRKYVKSNAFKRKRENISFVNGESNTSGNNHNSDELIYNMVSQDDFLQLTDCNSRLYATYVLNNPSNKSVNGQREILEILEYSLPEDCILRRLYREVKRIKRTNEDIKSSKELKKKDIISAYGLKSTNSKGSRSRLLRQLQINGMSVDVSNVDNERRSVNVVTGKRKRASTYDRNQDSDSMAYSDRESSATERVNPRGSTSNRFTEQNNKNVDTIKELGSGKNESKVSRKDVHLVSCLDPSIMESDRVKMMNLNMEDIRASFTRVYGMPKGLSPDEIEDDLLTIRQYNDEMELSN